MKAKICVLISGGGTNLQAILDGVDSGLIKDGEVVLVISSKAGAYGLTRAANKNIDNVVIARKDFESQKAFEDHMADLIEAKGIDLIVLAGYLSILSEGFTGRFPNKIINIHPSLIPAFCGPGFYGLKVHEAAIQAGVKVSGATVHYVNEVCDGGQIIDQDVVRVEEGDTPESLQKRILENVEHVLLPKVVEDLCKKIVEEYDEK